MSSSHVLSSNSFQQGQTFEKPEVVPFRLTHNMIDAFGAYGYNGKSDRSCYSSVYLLMSYR